MSETTPLRKATDTGSVELALRLKAEQAHSAELKHLSRPFWAMISIGIVSLMVFVTFLAYSLDRNSIEGSEQVFGSVVADRRDTLSNITLEYAYWDNAVENLVETLDLDWVENTFVDYINEDLKISGMHLVDGSGNAKLHVVDDQIAEADLLERYGPTLETLIAEARKSPSNQKPKPATGFVGSLSDLYLASAVVMTTYTGEEDISTDHVLVFAQSVDDKWLSNVADQYRMTGLRVSDQPAGFWNGGIPIEAADREFLGEFVWAPALPGSRLLPFLGLGMLLVFLAMFFAARLFFRRAAETVNALENAKNDAETARELLADQARTDPLTELGNRRHLDERIEYLENHSNVREHGLLYLDLDRFKQINDTYGHEAGDKVLRHVALALKTLAREDETIVRMGGDEFVIIFENALRQRVLSVGRTILEHLGEPFEIDGAVYRFGASIGIAFSEVPSELLRQADVALYSAKRQGRGQMAVYTSDLLDLDNLPIETSA